MDTVYVMLRRMIRGMNPFSADRRHVHHTLIYMGLSETQSSWLLLAASLLFGGIGFFGWFYGIPEYVLTVAFLATFLAHCTLMQRWREIFRFFGRSQRKSVAQPIAEVKALAE